MNKRTFIAAAIVACSFAVTASASPALRAGRTQSNQSSPPVSDQSFVQKALQGDTTEIELAQLAQNKAQNRSVQELARMLERDHRSAHDELQSIANRKKLSVNTQPSRDQTTLHAELEGASGSAFDRMFVTTMINDHRAAIGEFEKAANSADPDIKAYATKMLPKLREHLQAAENALRTLG